MIFFIDIMDRSPIFNGSHLLSQPHWLCSESNLWQIASIDPYLESCANEYMLNKNFLPTKKFLARIIKWIVASLRNYEFASDQNWNRNAKHFHQQYFFLSCCCSWFGCSVAETTRKKEFEQFSTTFSPFRLRVTFFVFCVIQFFPRAFRHENNGINNLETLVLCFYHRRRSNMTLLNANNLLLFE